MTRAQFCDLVRAHEEAALEAGPTGASIERVQLTRRAVVGAYDELAKARADYPSSDR